VSQAAPSIQPQELAVVREDDGVCLTLRVPEDLIYFEGHFPDCAILPGVVQLKWAIEYGRRYFALSPRFVGISNMKFMRVIVPGKTTTLTLAQAASGNELSFQYAIGEEVCSTGSISFAA